MGARMDRLKASEIKEAKSILLESQKYLCALCDQDLSEVQEKNICLDHSHVTGCVRAVLCRNCNSIEGRIWNFANRAKRNHTIVQWLKRMMDYIEYHENNPSGIYHPKHKTENEKRLARNKKARLRAKKKKQEQ